MFFIFGITIYKTGIGFVLVDDKYTREERLFRFEMSFSTLISSLFMRAGEHFVDIQHIALRSNSLNIHCIHLEFFEVL